MSRKKKSEAASPAARRYHAALYLRLSYAKDKSAESDSIANQKKLIEDYLMQHPEIEVVCEFADDGYSGVLFDRPGFQKMMEAIMQGLIDCVIVKDLSRLGREYIETGRYLRRIFPAYNVRFIAINDGVDTAAEKNGDDLMISMKNIINDTYSRDISVKTKSSLDIKRKSGEYVGACPPYGYQRSPDNKNRLTPDKDTARIVRDIYRQRINGMSAKKIAEDLNRRGVLSPLAYKISRGLPHPTGGYADSADAKWTPNTVLRILQDETYTGTLIQGRYGTHNHKLKEVVEKPESEWVRVEGAHEAIIRKRDFDLVQKIMRLDTRTAPDGSEVYLFSGLLLCGCCGGCMTRKTNTIKGRKYVYYYCRTGKKNGCEHPVMLREDELIQCVLESIQSHIKSVVSLEELLDSINEEELNRDVMEGYQTQIAENRRKKEEAVEYKTKLYENFIKGLFDKAEYSRLKNYYTEQIEQAQAAIELLRADMERVKNNAGERLKWTQHFKQFSTMTELDRRAVIALVESIQILGKTEIKITFRYQMEYETALAHLAQTQDAKTAMTLLLPHLAMLESEVV